MSETDSRAEQPRAAPDTPKDPTRPAHAGRSNAKPPRNALAMISDLLSGGSGSSKRKAQSQGVDVSSRATTDPSMSPIDPGGNGVSLEDNGVPVVDSQEFEDSPESETLGKSPQESGASRRYGKGGSRRRPNSQYSRAARDSDSRAPRGHDHRARREHENRAPREHDDRAPREQDNRAPPENDNPAPREHDHRAPRDNDSRPPREPRRSLVDELRVVREREKNHRETVQQLRGELQAAESEHEEYKSQIAKLSQIVQDLGKQGLPYPREDGYFSQEINHLWRDIGQFSRLASKDQEPIASNLSEILGPDTYSVVNSAFSDLPAVLSRKVPRTLRTKCMEVIIVKELEEMMFSHKIIGVQTPATEHIGQLWKLIMGQKTTTARDLHLWHALSIHLFTKDRDAFNARLVPEIEKATAKLIMQLTPLGAPGKLESFSNLKDIVSHAAKLTQEIAILPFVIQPVGILPGALFNPRLMQDDGLDDEDMSPEDLELSQIRVDVVFSQPVIKFAWDAEGGKVGDVNNPNVVVLCKGRVSCKR